MCNEMAVLGVVSTPNSEHAPNSSARRVVEDFPEIEIEVVQFAQRGTAAIPYFLVRGAPIPEFERTLNGDPHLSEITQLEHTGDVALFKVVWDVDSPMIFCIEETNGTIVEAHGTQDIWRLKVWFEENPDASSFHNCCQTNDIPLQVDRLVSLDQVLEGGLEELTDNQRETLLLAYREGYFDEPRAISQSDLADELGISPPAVGSRIRRGVRNLIEAALIE